MKPETCDRSIQASIAVYSSTLLAVGQSTSRST